MRAVAIFSGRRAVEPIQAPDLDPPAEAITNVIAVS